MHARVSFLSMPLNFDFPVQDEEGGTGFMLEVYAGASVTFMGKFRGSKVTNIRSMFYNSGTIE